jgi:hypothetical protein
MFDYLYWTETIDHELRKQIKFFNYQAQLVLEGSMLLELGPAILKAQMEGKFFELVIYLQSNYKAMEVGNLLHRIVSSGARVGIIEGRFNLNQLEIFGIFDNKLLVSNTLYDESENFMELIRKKHRDFELHIQISEKVNLQSQPIKISFSSTQYFVRKGEEFTLNWQIENSLHQEVYPYPGAVECEGNYQCFIENDTLFTIQAKNIKNKSLLSIFIKLIEEDHIKFILSVYNNELGQYISINPIPDDLTIYAVYKGDLVKVEWVTSSGSVLTEASMGKLKNTDFVNFVANESKKLEFDLQMGEAHFEKSIKIFTLPSPSSESISEDIKSLASNLPSEHQVSDEGSWKKWIGNLWGSKKQRK